MRTSRFQRYNFQSTSNANDGLFIDRIISVRKGAETDTSLPQEYSKKIPRKPPELSNSSEKISNKSLHGKNSENLGK